MRLAISFSGGRTSAVMTKLLFDECRDASIVFANTGCEHPATLDFVNACDFHFGWDVVWLEAVVTHGDRVGIRHKVVNYHTADRQGKVFEEYIKKYGVPNQAYKQCTSRLKEEVMDSYRHRELGWKKGTYKTAIGIRADEIDRMSSTAEEKNLIYPLVKMGHTKQSVNAIVKSWPFDLQISGDHYGNCVWCWKKSLRKLLTVAKETPEMFDFPDRMEKTYGLGKNKNRPDIERDSMFRGYRSAEDIVRMAQTEEFEPYADDRQLTLFDQIGYDELLDIGSACGESCEIGADE
jgi:hypothetical protein